MRPLPRPATPWQAANAADPADLANIEENRQNLTRNLDRLNTQLNDIRSALQRPLAWRLRLVLSRPARSACVACWLNRLRTSPAHADPAEGASPTLRCTLNTARGRFAASMQSVIKPTSKLKAY